MKKPFLVFFAGFAFLSLFFPLSKVFAATSIYYSVGQNTTDHKTCTAGDCVANPLTVTIDGSGVATFSAAQTATNTGVGDLVIYGGATSTIVAKASTSVWTLSTITGGLPAATTSAPVTSIRHAFASLAGAVGGGVVGNATSSAFLNTSNLVTGDYVLNIPLYYDGSADTSSPWIDGFVTDTSHYIRIYTPTSTASEVNQTQRHSGKYTSTKWRLESNRTFNDLVRINMLNVRLDGLQIRNTSSTSGADGVRFPIGATSPNGDLYISNNIIWDAPYSYALIFSSVITAGTGHVYIWNNVIQSGGASGALTIPAAGWAGKSFYVYNNTFYDNIVGIALSTIQVIGVFRNNIFASTTNPFTVNGMALAGSDYNSTDGASLGYKVTGSGNTHDATSTPFSFVDSTSDYRLSPSDSGARDVGLDLSADANLPFNTDIEGEARPSNSVWDRGADEFWPVDTTPPNINSSSPSGALATSTTSTTLSVGTNEASTCKYDTTPNTAYASMAHTFTTTGGTTHTEALPSISSGHIYTYYVRCQDVAGNPTTSDYTISFNVGTNGTAYATTCSQADVQAAIAIAIPGDTVSVPAGTCVWGDGNTSLLVNKAVTVKGAGRGATIIDLSTTGPQLTTGTISISAPATFMSFTVDATSTWASTTTAFSAQSNGFRISDILFNPSGFSSAYFLYGSSVGSYGLIDNCDITAGGGTDELIFVRGPLDSWQTPNSMGKSSALFIENSVFRGFGYITDCNANGRCVVRNLTLLGQEHADAHGPASNSPFNGVRQYEFYNNVWTFVWTVAVALELQGGTGMVFNNSAPNTPSGSGTGAFWLRDLGYEGGPWSNFGVSITDISVGNPSTITTASPHGFVDQQPVGFSSTVTTPSISGNRYIATVTGPNTFTIPVNITVGGSTGKVSDFNTLFDYPTKNQIGVGMDPKVAGSEPYYIWNNTKGGAPWPRTPNNIPADAITIYRLQTGSTTASYTQLDVIQANRDFFADAGFDTSTTTAGITSGLLSARPSTCRTGVGYWATDQGGSWDTSNGTGADGALYKCTATDTWSLYYTPYAYPHYLTAASTTNTDQVDIGAGARMFGNGKFYGFSTSTASGAYATLGITPSSTTSPDFWVDVTVSKWDNVGVREKTWTESSTNLGALSTSHVVGDLSPNTAYDVKVDGSIGSAVITGAACSSGVCTSDGTGKITFTYSGGYSTHTFDVQQSSGTVAPAMTTSAPTSVTTTSFTLQGAIVATGGADATQSGFAWGTVSNLLGGDTATTTEGAQTGTASFTHSLSSLSPSTVYYFRAYATNSAGTGYGSILSTTTLDLITAPSVSTSASSGVTASAATLNASITATGGADATQSGFAYSTDSALSTGVSTSTLGAQTGTASFSKALSGLSCNTTYYFRGYATNSAGTAYGSVLSFLTSPCVQTISTDAADSITKTSATLNASITATGGADATQSGFAYSTDSALSTGVSTSTLGAQTGTITFAQALTPLVCNTAYYFRAYTDNTAGRAFGAIESFTTSPCVTPTVTVQAASSISNTAALLNGTITNTGGENDTTQGFQYGLTTAYGATTSTSGSYAAGSFSEPVSGLVCNTLYHFQAFATNSAGTGYSADGSFTTAACSTSEPTVSTNAASAVSDVAAIMNASIIATGGADATESGFGYSTDSSLSTGVSTSTLGAQTGTASFSKALSGLSCNTTYYFRGYATNSAGTAYGSIQSFLTSPCVPTVTAEAATSVDLNSVTLNGTLADLGGTVTLSQGFGYGLTTAYGATSTSIGSFSVGSFGSSLSGLSCGATYHFRAYTANSAGVGYSSDSTFSTLSCQAPQVLSLAATDAVQTSATLNASIIVTGGADATQSGFAYSTDSALSTDVSTSTLGAQTGTASFSKALSGLSCNTTYYFRGYATNSAGTAYGSIASFDSSACPVTPEAVVPGPSSTPSAAMSGSSSLRRAALQASFNAAQTLSTANEESASAPSLQAFIETLINAGVIPQDKAASARQATSAVSSSIPRAGIQLHDRGDHVLLLQSLLTEAGYLKVDPNGIFGLQTFTALKKFQSEHGVPATGYYGLLTQALMAENLARTAR